MHEKQNTSGYCLCIFLVLARRVILLWLLLLLLKNYRQRYNLPGLGLEISSSERRVRERALSRCNLRFHYRTTTST